MNRLMILSALLAILGLTACDQPTVVNVPAGPAGPAGAKGATGNQGDTGAQGNKGEAGKPGDSTTVIVTPPAQP